MAHGVFLEAFGIDLDKPLDAPTLKVLGDKNLGILYDLDDHNNIVQRDPAAALRYFVNVRNYLDAFNKLTGDQKSDVNFVFNQAFGVTLGGRITPPLLKTLGDKAYGILYDQDGVFRDPEKAMQFFVGVYRYWQAYDALESGKRHLAGDLFFKIFKGKTGRRSPPGGPEDARRPEIRHPL